jgi:cell division protein FtsB
VRLLGLVLVALIVLIQYPLWLGKGSWLRAAEVDRQLAAQKAKNSELERRNAALAAEVRDLKTGTDAIEERARQELGMVRSDEVFYQYVEKPAEKRPADAAPRKP